MAARVYLILNHPIRKWLFGKSSGASALEFGLIAPVFMMLAVGIMQISLLFVQYIQLTNGVIVAAQSFGSSRGGSTTPYTDSLAALEAAAPSLAVASITNGFAVRIATSVSGTYNSCATDAACLPMVVAGSVVSVSASYPCDLTIMGFNYASSCSLSATTVEPIQ